MPKTFHRVIGYFGSLVLAVGLGCSTGCIKNIPLHPGAVNAVDNALYDGILTTRAAIEAAKDQFRDDEKVKLLLNQSVIPPFNRLEEAYKVYHTALLAGTSDPGKLAQLQVQLDSVRAALKEALKGAVAAIPVK